MTTTKNANHILLVFWNPSFICPDIEITTKNRLTFLRLLRNNMFQQWSNVQLRFTAAQ